MKCTRDQDAYLRQGFSRMPTLAQAKHCVSQEIAIEGTEHRFNVTDAELTRAGNMVISRLRKRHPGLSGRRKRRRR